MTTHRHKGDLTPTRQGAALTFPLRNAPRWTIEGTGRRGLLVLSLATVAARLGRPRVQPSEKSRHEWIVHTPHGPVAVYDYAVPTWPDDLGDVVVEWHLGAHHHLAVTWIARHLLSGCAHLTDPTASRCRHCPRNPEDQRLFARDDGFAELASATSKRTP